MPNNAPIERLIPVFECIKHAKYPSETKTIKTLNYQPLSHRSTAEVSILLQKLAHRIIFFSPLRYNMFNGVLKQETVDPHPDLVPLSSAFHQEYQSNTSATSNLTINNPSKFHFNILHFRYKGEK